VISTLFFSKAQTNTQSDTPKAPVDTKNRWDKPLIILFFFFKLRKIIKRQSKEFLTLFFWKNINFAKIEQLFVLWKICFFNGLTIQ